MSDKEHSLGTVLGKIPEQTFTDQHGIVHRLHPIDLNDMVELEETCGSLEQIVVKGGLKEALFVLWLSLRKDGLTPEQIDREEWTITTKTVGRMFGLGDAEKIQEITMRLMKACGMVEDDTAGNVESGAVVSPSAGPSSPPSPSNISESSPGN